MHPDLSATNTDGFDLRGSELLFLEHCPFLGAFEFHIRGLRFCQSVLPCLWLRIRKNAKSVRVAPQEPWVTGNSFWSLFLQSKLTCTCRCWQWPRARPFPCGACQGLFALLTYFSSVRYSLFPSFDKSPSCVSLLTSALSVLDLHWQARLLGPNYRWEATCWQDLAWAAFAASFSSFLYSLGTLALHFQIRTHLSKLSLNHY